MTTRYFKATNGARTTFRGTGRPDGFKFASWGTYGGISFHNAPKPGCYPAVEITAAEYKALTTLKMERLKRSNRDRYTYSTPQECWVYNADLVEVA